MILVQIATALAIGAYVVLSKDAQPKRPKASPRESFQHTADHLDRDGRRVPVEFFSLQPAGRSRRQHRKLQSHDSGAGGGDGQEPLPDPRQEIDIVHVCLLR
jgi:hypothetical protein